MLHMSTAARPTTEVVVLLRNHLHRLLGNSVPALFIVLLLLLLLLVVVGVHDRHVVPLIGILITKVVQFFDVLTFLVQFERFLVRGRNC